MPRLYPFNYGIFFSIKQGMMQLLTGGAVGEVYCFVHLKIIGS